MRVTWAALRKELAVPGLAISACSSTLSLPRSQLPSDFRVAISIWSPPNITTILSSPYFSGHFHIICFTKANSGWSNVTTGVWPGFTCSIVLILHYIHAVPDHSYCVGTVKEQQKQVGRVMVRANCGWRLACHADHDMFSSVPVLSSMTSLACSMHMYSSSVCSLKLFLVKDTILVAGTDMFFMLVVTGGTSV